MVNSKMLTFFIGWGGMTELPAHVPLKSGFYHRVHEGGVIYLPTLIEWIISQLQATFVVARELAIKV